MAEIWWTWSGSNRRPPRLRRGALNCFERVDQFLNGTMGLPAFKLSLAGQGFRESPELFLMDQQPWSTAAGGFGLSSIVFAQSRCGLFGTTDVESARAFTLQDVDGGHGRDLVDLVGIEPTTSSMPWKRAPSCATGPREEGCRKAGSDTCLSNCRRHLCLSQMRTGVGGGTSNPRQN